MSERDLISLLIKIKRGHNEEDIRFMRKIYDDVLHYTNESSKNIGLIFPPLDVCWRYMIHKLCEHKGLFGLTVGEGVRRMVLVIDMKGLELSAHLETTTVALLREGVLKRDGINNPLFSRFLLATNSSFNIGAAEFHPKKDYSTKDFDFSSESKSETEIAVSLVECPLDKKVNSENGNNLVNESKSKQDMNSETSIEKSGTSDANGTVAVDEGIIEVYQPTDLSPLYDEEYYNITPCMMMSSQMPVLYPDTAPDFYFFPEHTCYNPKNCMRCLEYALRHN